MGYDTRQAPDRRVRRLMDQENKKHREKARKRKNDTVRELVKFARRRDPRVIAQKEKEEKAIRAEERRIEELERRMEEAVLYEERRRNDSEALREAEELAALEAQFDSDEFEEKPKKKGKKGKQKNKYTCDTDEELQNEDLGLEIKEEGVENKDDQKEIDVGPSP